MGLTQTDRDSLSHISTQTENLESPLTEKSCLDCGRNWRYTQPVNPI